MDPVTRGDPMSPLRWTSKSLRTLAKALQEQGHQVSEQIVRRLLKETGYSLQANAKTLEGGQFTNGGRDYRPAGSPVPVNVHDFATTTGPHVTVCHLPPGTSKWNKIEHRLFSHITMNWRGTPLTSHQTVVNLIGAVSTTTGLKVHAELDERDYPTGIKISDADMDALPIHRHDWRCGARLLVE